jgi:putative hydrolase of the HAD superfamily
MTGALSAAGRPGTVPRMPAPPLAAHQVETWVFDLDNTLYPARCNLFGEVDRRMTAFVSHYLGVDPVEAKRQQKELFRQYGSTMRGMMLVHGMQPGPFLHYVHDIDLSLVPPGGALNAALGKLPGRKLVFTNGSVRHAERILDRLGITDHFDGIFDIVAAGYLPKPDPEPYRQLVARHDMDPKKSVMVEDIARNLVPARAMGMTTVWVPGHEDWSAFGVDQAFLEAHVHHIADDLTAFLEKLTA